MHGFIRNPGSCDVVIDRLGHLARAFLGASGVETVEISRHRLFSTCVTLKQQFLGLTRRADPLPLSAPLLKLTSFSRQSGP